MAKVQKQALETMGSNRNFLNGGVHLQGEHRLNACVVMCLEGKFYLFRFIFISFPITSGVYMKLQTQIWLEAAHQKLKAAS